MLLLDVRSSAWLTLCATVIREQKTLACDALTLGKRYDVVSHSVTRLSSTLKAMTRGFLWNVSMNELLFGYHWQQQKGNFINRDLRSQCRNMALKWQWLPAVLWGQQQGYPWDKTGHLYSRDGESFFTDITNKQASKTKAKPKTNKAWWLF